MSLPADTVNQLRELYEQGMNPYAISRYTGINRGTVRVAIGDLEGSIRISDKMSARQRQRLLTKWKTA